MKFITSVMLLVSMPILAKAQYDPKYVETKTLKVDGETYAIEKLMRKEGKVKVKYFAYKDGSTSVYQRYTAWAANRRVIAVSSGTYMTTCNVATAQTVGLCIDNGRLVNNSLSDRMDGLIIVYPTGGLAATNIRDGNLSVRINGRDRVLDLRRQYDQTEFIDWAKSEQATIFQSHLFVYKNELKITDNGSEPARKTAPRRFLAVCQSGTEYIHYIVNLPAASTLYNGTVKALKYLNNLEQVNVVFMVNLDPGCQDVYKIFDKTGKEVKSKNFSGTLDTSQAANLLVYYYE
jgi:hypothetical protein